MRIDFTPAPSLYPFVSSVTAVLPHARHYIRLTFKALRQVAVRPKPLGI